MTKTRRRALLSTAAATALAIALSPAAPTAPPRASAQDLEATPTVPSSSFILHPSSFQDHPSSFLLSSPTSSWNASAARVIRVDGPIIRPTFDYIDRAVAVAEAGGDILIVELDTPGGDVGSMGRIAERFLNAESPIIVWVGPRGAQAASAGTFVVLAAHAAGMAPSTTIGAASPVGAQGADLPETIASKITEDLSAQARNLASRRGEEAVAWAERAVRDADSATAEEALALGVIDAVAENPAALLAALDGTTIDMAGREAVISAPEASEIQLQPIPMTAAERLLMLLVQPAIALLLLTLGVNAILIELSNPGMTVAGVVGILALALGFYSLGVLEANWVGLVFFAVAAGMFIMEVQAPTYGLFLVIGLGLFIAGSVILFAGTPFGVPWVTVGALAVISSLFTILVVGAIWRSRRRVAGTGFEGMLGQKAEVRVDLAPSGKVLMEGEIWDAVVQGATTVVPRGTVVTVVGREGFMLQVRPVDVDAVNP